MAELARIPRTLKENEAVIETHQRSFLLVAQALLDIKEEKQYRDAGYKTFDDYCHGRWSISARRGYQYIEAAEASENVKNFTQNVPSPTTESQAAELAKASDDPKKQAEVWIEAVKATDGKPTAKAVKEAAAKLKEEAEPKDDDNPKNLRVIVVDAMDGPIADVLHADWDAITEFRSIGTAIGSLGKRIKELAETPGGRKIPWVEIHNLQKELQRALKFAKPHTECFRCQRKVQSDCKLCGGAGWLNETEYSRNRTEGGDKWLKSRE